MLTRFLCLVAILSIAFGYINNPISRQQKLSNIQRFASPGEVNTSPINGVTVASNQFKKLALPIAAFASIMLPFLANNMPALAADVATSAAPEAKVELGPLPTDFGLVYKDFYGDAQKVVNHMRYASQMEKGNPGLADIAQKTKDEMLDFVSYYRRFSGVQGKQTFSLLYTSINVLSGHYTSYGVKFPVPEKRRKRLLQEFNDIEKNIRKKR